MSKSLAVCCIHEPPPSYKLSNGTCSPALGQRKGAGYRAATMRGPLSRSRHRRLLHWVWTQTRRSTWTSSTEYSDDLIDHLLRSASTRDDLKQSQSFTLPSIMGHLTRIRGEEKTGPFRLTNRDLEAHNILVDDDLDIVGVIDFGGVMAGPLEVVAQYPVLSFLDTEPPGATYTAPAEIERVIRTASKLQECKDLRMIFESDTVEGEARSLTCWDRQRPAHTRDCWLTHSIRFM
ncbi:hypothetical protein N657DRAFT_430243 [Parathielavia appendiculata]|uniref:Aminoglycoside phosphotransferase domain-containing protein n=1 Tax=Parathielavia appendiculata TaxID=2587402 RepID=A0AAN6Z3P6_9PEZI|nr:hypothetical protein N657DRAFT_430243 [Parathielavia appendiculata]